MATRESPLPAKQRAHVELQTTNIVHVHVMKQTLFSRVLLNFSANSALDSQHKHGCLYCYIFSAAYFYGVS